MIYCLVVFITNLQNNFVYSSLNVRTGIKRCNINENSSMIWHWRLGHISIERVKRLVKDVVLNTLDFVDFETCVDCIKGKHTNMSKKGSAQGQKYFITFIDDYTRCMNVYLLNNKNESLDAFNVFKAEVENQCGKKIKIVRTDRDGEYYGRYNESGQTPGSLAKFLQEHGNCCPIHYSWFYKPKWCCRKKKPNNIGHGAEYA